MGKSRGRKPKLFLFWRSPELSELSPKERKYWIYKMIEEKIGAKKIKQVVLPQTIKQVIEKLDWAKEASINRFVEKNKQSKRSIDALFKKEIMEKKKKIILYFKILYVVEPEMAIALAKEMKKAILKESEFLNDPLDFTAFLNLAILPALEMRIFYNTAKFYQETSKRIQKN